MYRIETTDGTAWIDADWSETAADGVRRPARFASEDDARDAIAEHVADSQAAGMPVLGDDFRVAPVSYCRNGHDRDALGINARGACMECKRVAARTYAARRAAGVPLIESKRQARTDLGYSEVSR